MKILLTGYNGYLGSNLSAKIEYGDVGKLPWTADLYLDEFTSLGRNIDIKDERLIKGYLKEANPDVIIHLAANPRGNADISAMDDNCKGTHNLVHYAPEGCHFIFASTIVVYGDFKHFKFLEDMTPQPTSLYALSKLNAENIINRYARLGKIKKTNLRFCALVGGDNMSHGFIYDLVNKIKKDSSDLELIGNKPGAKKPFLHMDDACSVIKFVIENQIEGTYNICPMDNISVEDVAKLGMESFGKQKNIVWRPDQVWSGDNPEIMAGNCKIYSKGFEFKYKTSKAAIKAHFDALSSKNI